MENIAGNKGQKQHDAYQKVMRRFKGPLNQQIFEPNMKSSLLMDRIHPAIFKHHAKTITVIFNQQQHYTIGMNSPDPVAENMVLYFLATRRISTSMLASQRSITQKVLLFMFLTLIMVETLYKERLEQDISQRRLNYNRIAGTRSPEILLPTSAKVSKEYCFTSNDVTAIMIQLCAYHGYIIHTSMSLEHLTGTYMVLEIYFSIFKGQDPGPDKARSIKAKPQNLREAATSVLVLMKSQGHKLFRNLDLPLFVKESATVAIGGRHTKIPNITALVEAVFDSAKLRISDLTAQGETSGYPWEKSWELERHDKHLRAPGGYMGRIFTAIGLMLPELNPIFRPEKFNRGKQQRLQIKHSGLKSPLTRPPSGFSLLNFGPEPEKPRYDDESTLGYLTVVADENPAIADLANSTDSFANHPPAEVEALNESRPGIEIEAEEPRPIRSPFGDAWVRTEGETPGNPNPGVFYSDIRDVKRGNAVDPTIFLQLEDSKRNHTAKGADGSTVSGEDDESTFGGLSELSLTGRPGSAARLPFGTQPPTNASSPTENERPLPNRGTAAKSSFESGRLSDITLSMIEMLAEEEPNDESYASLSKSNFWT